MTIGSRSGNIVDNILVGRCPRRTSCRRAFAPGQHRAFLKWMADRDAIGKSIGLPQAQWYVHMEGGSWDYDGIAPVLTDAQQEQEDDGPRPRA